MSFYQRCVDKGDRTSLITGLYHNPELIKNIINQNEELCLIAVKQNGLLLEFVKNKSFTICYHAIKNNSFSIKYTNYSNKKLRNLAIKNNPESIKYINYPSFSMMYKAVKLNGLTLKYVDQTNDILCIKAVRNNAKALKYIKCFDIYEYWEKTTNQLGDVTSNEFHNGFQLDDIKYKNINYKYLLSNFYNMFENYDPFNVDGIKWVCNKKCIFNYNEIEIFLEFSFLYCKNENDVISLLNSKNFKLKYPSFIKYINCELSNDTYNKLIKLNPEIIKYIDQDIIDKEILIDLIKKDNTILRYIKNKDINICMEAIKSNENSIVYIQDCDYNEICCMVPDKLYKYIKNKDYNKCLMLIKNKLLSLKYIKNQTREMCIEAVKINGLELEFALYKDDEICEMAFKNNYKSIKYINNPTKNMCIEAIKKNSMLLEYIKNQDKELCILAINKNPLSFRFVKIQDEELCNLAIRKNYLNLQYVINQTYEMCYEIVKINGLALQYANFQNEEICFNAIKQNIKAIFYCLYQNDEMYKFIINKMKISKNYCKNIMEFILLHNKNMGELLYDIYPKAIKYVKNQDYKICFSHLECYPKIVKYMINQTDEVCYKAIRKDYKNIKYVKNQKEGYCHFALDISCKAIKYIKNPDNNMMLRAVKNNGKYLKYINNQTKEICLAAFENNPKSIIYVNKNFCDFDKEFVTIYLKMYKFYVGYHIHLVKKIKNDYLKEFIIRRHPNHIKYIKYSSYKLPLIAINSEPSSAIFIKNMPIELKLYLNFNFNVITDIILPNFNNY